MLASKNYDFWGETRMQARPLTGSFMSSEKNRLGGGEKRGNRKGNLGWVMLHFKGGKKHLHTTGKRWLGMLQGKLYLHLKFSSTDVGGKGKTKKMDPPGDR